MILTIFLTKMENDEADEITEGILRINSQKTTKHKLKELELSNSFQKDLAELRKKVRIHQ